jgi:hypothetical protein
MFTLPAFPPRRAWLRAFWTALSLSAGVLFSALLAITWGWAWIAAAPAIAAGLVFPGWMWPRIIEYPYRAWNKLAREFVRFARFWVLAVSYYVIFIPVSWKGALFRVAAPKPGESLWMEHQTLSPEARSSTHGRITGGDRNHWTVWLIPFLLLLSMLGTDEQKGSVPSNIYTLY